MLSLLNLDEKFNHTLEQHSAWFSCLWRDGDPKPVHVLGNIDLQCR